MNQDYRKMIHSIVVPDTLPYEEQNKRYQPLIDFLKTNTPEKLYRFRSCKERAFDEFDRNRLGFSPAYKMNDDFDGMLCFNRASIRATLVDALAPQKIENLAEMFRQGIITDEIRKRFPSETLKSHLDSLSKCTPEMLDSLIDQFLNYATDDYEKRMSSLAQLTQSVKIVSLSTEINSPAMWGYYANDGKGFALSYDLRKPDFTEYCPVPVIYDDERFDAPQYATWLFQQQVMERLFADSNALDLYPLFQPMIPCPDKFMPAKILIHKATYWSHEKEWRLIYYRQSTPQNIEFPFVIHQPTGVYLGRNISPIHEKILRHIAEEKGIPIYKMEICEDSQAYNLHPKLI